MSIFHTLTQSCDLYAPLVQSNGRPGYSETATAEGERCRVEASSRELRRDKDTVIALDAVVFLGPLAAVAEQYKLVCEGKAFIVEKVEPVRGLTGLSHYELLCRGI